MSDTAWLKAENLDQFCPVTNLYKCSDGAHVLVTVKDVPALDSILTEMGVRIPIAKSHAPKGVEAFLADADGVVLDADGEPANGMTPLYQTDETFTHAEVLSALGYTETFPPPTPESAESSYV